MKPTTVPTKEVDGNVVVRKVINCKRNVEDYIKRELKIDG